MNVLSVFSVQAALLCAAVLTLSCTALAGEWYVAPPGDDAADCRTPVTACATIGAALAQPGFALGDTVRVAVGRYTSVGPEVVAVTSDAVLSGGWNAEFTHRQGFSVIDGEEQRRGLLVPQGVSAVVERFAITRGAGAIEGGGGLFNAGALRLSMSVVRDSRSHQGIRGGGILNAGRLTLERSTVSGNEANEGGGIFNGGLLGLRNSSVDSNTAYSFGGGIHNSYGTVRLDRSAVIRNTISEFGAGRGAGIYSDRMLVLVNSTVSGNSALSSFSEGGGIHHGGNNSWVLLFNATVTANSANDAGGIFTGGGVNSGALIRNTILAGNVASFNSDCRGVQSAGPTYSGGYNLLGSPSGCAYIPAVGDRVNVNPLLGPLADNRGWTPTHALLSGSPAIDGGNPAGCTDRNGDLLATDQRGAARPQGAACDIGAYEFALVADSDGDGVEDDLDNCMDVFNPDQPDSDSDGYGDVCDLDLEVMEP